MGKELLPSLINVDPFDFGKKTKDEHLVFEERVWGLKQGENFVFDPDHYGIKDFLSLDNPPKDAVLSDTVIRYYSSGRREVVPAEKIKMFQIGKNLWERKPHCFGTNISWATMENMLTMFPKDTYLKMLCEKYPYLKKTGRFALNLDTDEYELAMPLDKADCVAGTLKSIANYLRCSDLGNLHKFFGGYAHWLTAGVEENNQAICAELDKKMGEHPIQAHCSNGRWRSYGLSCTLYSGYTDLSYNTAETMLKLAHKDIKPLREEYLQNGEPLHLTYGLQIFSKDKCNDYSSFDKDFGCPKGVFLFVPEVFSSWGKQFLPFELEIIHREREFCYWNPDLPDYRQKNLIHRQMSKKKTSKVMSNFLKIFQ